MFGNLFGKKTGPVTPVDVNPAAVRERLAHSQPWEKLSGGDKRDVVLALGLWNEDSEKRDLAEKTVKLLWNVIMTWGTLAPASPKVSEKAAKIEKLYPYPASKGRKSAKEGTYYAKHKKKLRRQARKYYKHCKANHLGLSLREVSVRRYKSHKVTR